LSTGEILKNDKQWWPLPELNGSNVAWFFTFVADLIACRAGIFVSSVSCLASANNWVMSMSWQPIIRKHYS
jgi:hypothetical protein